MKKLSALLIISISYLFLAGCATQSQMVPAKAEPSVAINRVDSIKPGKEDGTIDKEFFKKIVAEKPQNVTFVDVRTPFEFKAGHIDGSQHLHINELFTKGCEATIAKLPKEGYIVFVCATGARAGEMYFGLVDDCKYTYKASCCQ
jgi:hypothetical protein